jgi:CBS domain-containing protein
MNVGELCSRDAVTASANAPLMEVARLMRDQHVGVVVVTKTPIDEPVAAGIISDRDMVRALLKHPQGLTAVRAEDVMTHDPLVLSEEDSVDEAIRRMRARGVRRAPVVTSHGMLVGLVSTDDLFAQVARELVDLATLLEQQPRRERA